MRRANSDGRHTYWRFKAPLGTYLLRDDTYRMAFIRETPNPGVSPEKGLDDQWTGYVDYKQCGWGGVADAINRILFKAMEPAPIDTIRPELLNNTDTNW